ncbi:WLM domain-containing protein [Mycena galopus ATCC 62051]|nr:WLM domain-containing protein [Mycena galopus ATCC 62051]
MVFAGRNWNAGETVELVLRGPDGLYRPKGYIMSTLCHEHMNHGPAFQALWARFRAEVRALQDKGYYGDGMWSAGTRLIDSAEVIGVGMEAGEFPEFLCGGAQKQSRPSALGRKRRRARRETVASNKTGRQTAKKRKAGSRVKSQYAFAGEGSVLTEGALDPKGKGVGFRKQAGSKRAREERALAAEQRIKALQAAERRNGLQPKASTSKADKPESEEEDAGDLRQASTSKPSSQWETLSEAESEEVEELDEDELGDEPVGETDAERRQALLRSGEDSGALTNKDWNSFQKDFNFTRHAGKKASEPIEILSDDDDIPVASGSTFVMPSPNPARSKDSRSKKTGALGLGNMKESLGMAPVKPGTRVLGSVEKTAKVEPSQWACHMCTLLNKESFLACSVCSTPRK